MPIPNQNPRNMSEFLAKYGVETASVIIKVIAMNLGKKQQALAEELARDLQIVLQNEADLLKFFDDLMEKESLLSSKG